jgi:hypothetical protein
MTTLGNQYTPVSTLAHVLEVGANTTGILLLGVVVARAIGLISDARMAAPDVNPPGGTGAAAQASAAQAAATEHQT